MEKVMEEKMIYDAAIIGTGPAGISAAITLKIRNKNVLLLGSRNLSSKIEKAHLIQNYPGLPSVTGKELKKNFLKHLELMGIEITEDQITGCYPMGNRISLLSKSNREYTAKTLIVATGVNFGKPYEGEEEFLGRGVSYCATCDAPLYRGKSCVIIGQTAAEEKEAEFMAELCSKVTYVPLYKEDPKISEKVEVLKDVPVRIEGDMKARKLVLKNAEIEADGFFILRESISPKQLVSGLKIEGSHILVDRNMETNIPGIFACGDVTGLPYQYIKAAGEGNVAALSAVKYL